MSKLDNLRDLRDQLNDLQDSGAKLTGAELDFIASFDRAVMDAEDGVADSHYSGFDYADELQARGGLSPVERARQLLNSHLQPTA